MAIVRLDDTNYLGKLGEFKLQFTDFPSILGYNSRGYCEDPSFKFVVGRYVIKFSSPFVVHLGL